MGGLEAAMPTLYLAYVDTLLVHTVVARLDVCWQRLQGG